MIKDKTNVFVLPVDEFVVWSTEGPVAVLGVAPLLLVQSKSSAVGSLVQEQRFVSKSQDPSLR